jgi:hypothetical protein
MGSASTDQVPDLLAADKTINQSQWGPVITTAKDFLTFDANSSSSGTSPKFFDFAFTSTANQADFQTASDVLQDNHNGLLLGLDTTRNTNFQQSLSDVITTFGIPNLGSGTLNKIVSEVEETGKVTIASSSTDLYRNGMWIFPQDASTLQVRNLIFRSLMPPSPILGPHDLYCYKLLLAAFPVKEFNLSLITSRLRSDFPSHSAKSTSQITISCRNWRSL